MAIGRVVSGFSFLEFNIRETAVELVGPDHEVGRLLLANRSTTELLNTFGALVEHRLAGPQNAESRAALHDAIREVDRVQQQRNMVVHSTWMYVRQGRRMIPVHWKPRAHRAKGLTNESGQKEAEEVHQIADDIDEARKHFLKAAGAFSSWARRTAA